MKIFEALIEWMMNRTWTRVLLCVVAFFLIYIVLPWALNVPPMERMAQGIPYIESDY